jgi:hypothetical protein
MKTNHSAKFAALSTLLLVSLSANAATEFTPLGDLPDGDTRSFARDVSADGSVVVGLASSAPGMEAFRWTSAGGMGRPRSPGRWH